MKLPSVPATVFRTIKTASFPGYISQSSTLPVTNAFTLSASLFSDFTALAAVFDQYRIPIIEVTFNPQTTEGIPTTTFGPPKGLFRTVLDYDDGTALSSAGQADAYANAIETEVIKPQRRCYRPRIAVAGYAGAFNGFTNIAAPWIDAASSSIQHYGLKYYVDVGTTSNTVSYDVVCRVLFEFRASR